MCILIHVCVRTLHTHSPPPAGACLEESQICIVTELQRCSVHDAVVERKEAFSQQDIVRILYQVESVCACVSAETCVPYTVSLWCAASAHGGRYTP
jgi:hypothetical protein